MILLDLSQVLHSAIGVSFHNDKEEHEFSEDVVRYLVLNIIRSNKVKFEQEYGQLVICCDGSNTWRKQKFPYYKIKRSEAKEESLVDWKQIYTAFNKIREELKEYFPYPVIHVNHAEGDDVIAIMTQEFHNEKIMILSSDKDFKQLQTNPNVHQYSPVLKSDVKTEDPVFQLRELILKGDASDGVPSVFCDDNYLAIREKGMRVRSISKKMITESLEDLDSFINKYGITHFNRNQQLIDLSKIPEEIKTNILEEYHSQLRKPKQNILSYLMKHKQKMLLDNISDFALPIQKRNLTDA